MLNLRKEHLDPKEQVKLKGIVTIMFTDEKHLAILVLELHYFTGAGLRVSNLGLPPSPFNPIYDLSLTGRPSCPS